MLLSEIKLHTFYFNNHRVFLIKNFGISLIEQQLYYNKIVDEFFIKKNLYPFKDYEASNVSLEEDEYFELLYSKFVCLCFFLFKDIKLSSKNKNVIYAYLNNKDFFETNIHNHSETSTINGVFYFNVPYECNNKSKLIFFDNDKNKIGDIAPETNDLIIFSHKLNHMPLQSMTHEYRIALNMELRCNEKILKNFYT